VTAERATRDRSAIVERGMDALARLDDADRLDAREDAAIARIHQTVHVLEEIDAKEDAARAALREDLRVVTGYVDRLGPEQLPLPMKPEAVH
jgi:hypothetical protein